MHLERDKNIFCRVVDSMHGLAGGVLLGASIDNNPVRPQLIWANEGVFHCGAKVERFVTH
jgi:hypothetical protein